MDDSISSKAEVLAPNSTICVYQEAISELETCERDEAKQVIKRRMLEIRRMEACLEKAKKDLAELLEKNVSEIAMLP